MRVHVLQQHAHEAVELLDPVRMVDRASTPKD
jgi:hypothetical protein